MGEMEKEEGEKKRTILFFIRGWVGGVRSDSLESK